MTNAKRRMATIKSGKSKHNAWAKPKRLVSVFAFLIVVAGVLWMIPELKVMVEQYQQGASSIRTETQVVKATADSESLETSDWVIAFETPVDFIDSVELESFVKAKLQMSFFALDVNEASTVLKLFPWIKDVTARKVWPNTLVVQVTEHQPWLNLNHQALISTEGEVFEPSNIEDFHALPVLKGKFGKVEDLLSMYKFFSEQMPTNEFRITELEFSVIDGWHMKLKNGIALMLGNKDLADRLDRFLSIVEQLPEQKTEQIKYLDMRYQTGVAVGWRALNDEQIARL